MSKITVGEYSLRSTAREGNWTSPEGVAVQKDRTLGFWGRALEYVKLAACDTVVTPVAAASRAVDAAKLTYQDVSIANDGVRLLTDLNTAGRKWRASFFISEACNRLEKDGWETKQVSSLLGLREEKVKEVRDGVVAKGIGTLALAEALDMAEKAAAEQKAAPAPAVAPAKA